VPEADFASFASAFVRLAAGIKGGRWRYRIRCLPERVRDGGIRMRSGHHTLLAGVCLITDADRIFDLGDVAKRDLDRNQ